MWRRRSGDREAGLGGTVVMTMGAPHTTAEARTCALSGSVPRLDGSSEEAGREEILRNDY